MMKAVLLTIAICLAVASAQNIAASFTYRGSADCSDNTKIVQALVDGSGCTADPCKVSTDNGGFTTVTRCYKAYADIPLPSNAMTTYAPPKPDCSVKASGAGFNVPGIAGCVPSSSTESRYFAVCNATSSGSMLCTGSSDCSSGCVPDSTSFPGKEGECTSRGPIGTYFVCKIDFTGIEGVTAPSASPVSGSSPSASPAATPARRSSATQVVINVFGLISIIIALVF